jgi:hypothetical protein
MPTAKEHAEWLREIADGPGIGPGYAVRYDFDPDERSRLRELAAILDSLSPVPVQERLPETATVVLTTADNWLYPIPKPIRWTTPGQPQ